MVKDAAPNRDQYQDTQDTHRVRPRTNERYRHEGDPETTVETNDALIAIDLECEPRYGHSIAGRL